MKAFTFVRPTTVEEAAKAAAEKGSVIKAGGIDLLDRMKERVDQPDRVVWLGDLPNHGVGMSDPGGMGVGPDSALVIGARTTLAQLAEDAQVRVLFPALAESAALAASPQIRARATVGGNLMQQTRCGYFRHRSFPCFKRGDETCPVLSDGAVQDTAAIFGNRPCASAHASSLAPVLCAADATIFVANPIGKQSEWRLVDVYAPPRRGVASDIDLGDGNLIVSVFVPRARKSVQSHPVRAVYEEIRQKAAFDWALVSACVRLDMDGDKVKDAGVWLGAVAPTPWHAEAAEKALVGKSLTDDVIRAAAEAAVTGATPLPGNSYKVDLVKVVVRRALERLRAMK